MARSGLLMDVSPLVSSSYLPHLQQPHYAVAVKEIRNISMTSTLCLMFPLPTLGYFYRANVQ